jgi:protein phosphatase
VALGEKQYIGADFSDRERIICISDMHGDMELFSALLEKVKPTDKDALVIIGDFSNKGPDCREMTDLVFKLDKRENVYVLAGNGENFNAHDYLSDRRWLLRYMPKWKGNLFSAWAQELGFAEVGEENLEAACDAIDREFGHIIDWLRDLSLYLETPDTIFVHAGMREVPAEGMANPKLLLRDQTFLLDGENRTGKRVIVGHYPTANFGKGYASNGLLVDEAHGIIGIDGGVMVKRWCRLNALIIKSGELSCEYVHRFPLFEAACDVFGENPIAPMQDSWPDYRLEVLQEGAEFSLCRKKISGQIGLVKNEHLAEDGEGFYYGKNSNSFFLSVKRGEHLALLDGCGGHAYVMKDGGEMGFVLRRAIGGKARENALR